MREPYDRSAGPANSRRAVVPRPATVRHTGGDAPPAAAVHLRPRRRAGCRRHRLLRHPRPRAVGRGGADRRTTPTRPPRTWRPRMQEMGSTASSGQRHRRRRARSCSTTSSATTATSCWTTTGDDPGNGWDLYLAHPADRTVPVHHRGRASSTPTFTDCEGRTITVDDLAPVPAGVRPGAQQGGHRAHPRPHPRLTTCRCRPLLLGMICPPHPNWSACGEEPSTLLHDQFGATQPRG